VQERRELLGGELIEFAGVLRIKHVPKRPVGLAGLR
jgi:hypothetical protein